MRGRKEPPDYKYADAAGKNCFGFLFYQGARFALAGFVSTLSRLRNRRRLLLFSPHHLIHHNPRRYRRVERFGPAAPGQFHQRNGLRAPVYVGDTALDEASACAVGCPFVHAAYGFGSAVAPLASIQAPSGLQAALAAL